MQNINDVKIAIVAITYNRLESLKRLLTSLENAFYDNNTVDLFISIDKSDTSVIEEFSAKYIWSHGEYRYIAHSKNMGLQKHILSCGELLNGYDGLVVLEDDITVAESFFLYTKACVQKYKDDDNIAGISLYSFPVNYQNQLPFYPLQSDSDVFLMNCAQSWGQVWMPRQWKMFREWYDTHCEEFVEKPHLPKAICSWPKSSWLKYHTRYCIEQNKYFVYPYVSLSTNNGDTSTHVTQKSTLFQASLLYGIKRNFNLNPVIRYDGFFENELLYDVLGLKEDELCIDFYGEKQNRMRCRYWLSRKQMPYKIIKSFALELFPYEMNIFAGRNGKELFLYDTSQKTKNRFTNIGYLFYCYIYHLKISRNFTTNIFKHIIQRYGNKIFRKI